LFLEKILIKRFRYNSNVPKGTNRIAVGGFYGEVFKNSPATSPDDILDMESSKRAGLTPAFLLLLL